MCWCLISKKLVLKMGVSYSLTCLYFVVLLMFLAVGELGIISADDQTEREPIIRKCSEDGPPIKFPFRFNEIQQPHYNGSGFNISCSMQNETILQFLTPLSQLSQLYIRKINYALQEIQVFYDEDKCLPTLLLLGNNENRSVNFPFQFRYDRKKKYKSYTLLDCPSYHVYKTFCNIMLIPSDSQIGLFPQRGCPKIYDAESIPDDIYKVGRSRKSKNYVSLTWSTPDCRSCEANRKGCRLKKDSDEVECFYLHKPRKGNRVFSFS